MHSLFEQSLWLLAITSSLLLLILLVLGLIQQPDTETEANARLSRIFNPRSILAFLAFFAWGSLCASAQSGSLPLILGAGLLAGLIAAATSKIVTLLLLQFALRSPVVAADRLVGATGQVLAEVPPHRNGFGKVHLSTEGTPYQLEAMTAGAALPIGAPVRVIEVIEGQVLVVEPLQV